MSKNEGVFDLPRFRERLSQLSAREAGLKPDTHQRYKKGRLPKALVDLLQRRPELAEALCDDLVNQRDCAA